MRQTAALGAGGTCTEQAQVLNVTPHFGRNWDSAERHTSVQPPLFWAETVSPAAAAALPRASVLFLGGSAQWGCAWARETRRRSLNPCGWNRESWLCFAPAYVSEALSKVEIMWHS